MSNYQDIRAEAKQIIEIVSDFISKNPDKTDESFHIDTIPGAFMSVKESLEVAKYLKSGSKVLDWGCGDGQLSFSLANRGIHVDACEFYPEPKMKGFIDDRINYFQLNSPTIINAPDNSYDAVVSGGTLEHVNDMFKSIEEISRILKPGGYFFVFRFPAKFSISEFVARKSGRWSHAVRFTENELAFFMRMHSFRVKEIGYDSFLPISFGKTMSFLRPLRSKLNQPISVIDSFLTRTPIINQFSTSIYCFAIKNDEYVERW